MNKFEKEILEVVREAVSSSTVEDAGEFIIEYNNVEWQQHFPASPDKRVDFFFKSPKGKIRKFRILVQEIKPKTPVIESDVEDDWDQEESWADYD